MSTYKPASDCFLMNMFKSGDNIQKHVAIRIVFNLETDVCPFSLRKFLWKTISLPSDWKCDFIKFYNRSPTITLQIELSWQQLKAFRTCRSLRSCVFFFLLCDFLASLNHFWFNFIPFQQHRGFGCFICVKNSIKASWTLLFCLGCKRNTAMSEKWL